jgi:hypothetical protein
MTAADLVYKLRARGVEIITDGARVGVRPAGVLTEEERAALRRHKAEVLAMLRADRCPPSIALDGVTVREALGVTPDTHALACLSFDVLAAVRQIEVEIATGAIAPRPLLVRGRPLADWLRLEDVARLLRRSA